MLNSQGKKLTPADIIFYPTLSLKLNACPILKPIRYSCLVTFANILLKMLSNFSLKQGGRDVMANILRVLTPGENMYPCSLGIGGGIGLFHGFIIRSKTSGQLPVVSLIS